MVVSFEEIAKQMKETDNYVSGEGAVCILMMRSLTDFYELFYEYQYTIMSSEDFIALIVERIKNYSWSERKNEIRRQKTMLLNLMRGSHLNDFLFTPNIVDMAGRIVDYSKRDTYYLSMGKYDFVPEGYQANMAMNGESNVSMQIHKNLLQLIFWRLALYKRYSEIIKLEKFNYYKMPFKDTSRVMELVNYEYVNNDLGWNLQKNELIALLKLFKKYFSRRTGLDMIADILLYPIVSGNIIWIGKTEALAYFFSQLFEQEYIRNSDWRMIFMNRLLFCSKKGNIITNTNINATLCRIGRKEITTREFKLIKQKLIDFKKIIVPPAT